MNTKLPGFPEETNLVEFADEGKTFKLHPEALSGWRKLKSEAKRQQIEIYIVSAFRNIARQEEIITAKRAKGLPDEEIFKASAPPGYSEHHTGKAIDIGTPGSPPLEEAFGNTDAFQWLLANASTFGFRLSYPRDNDYGIVYEPWHWFFVG